MNSKRPLSDWLGQRVRFQGYLDHWKPLDNGDMAYLLTNVRVRLYLGGEIRLLDHLWQIFPKEQAPTGNMNRLDQVSAIGDVIQYRRRNGTSDFAIKGFDSSRLLISPPSGNLASERFFYLKQCMEEIDKQIAYIPLETDIEQWRKKTADFLERLGRELDARFYYFYLSKQNSKPKPQIDILPFGKRKRR